MSQTSDRGPLRRVPEEAEAGVAMMGRATRTAGRAAEVVLDAARRLPRDTARLATATGRAAVEVVRHPEAVLDRARRLPLAVPMLRQAVTPILTGRVADWRGEYAYTAGMQAFIYGFPYIYNAQIRHDWVTQPRDPAAVPYAAVNHFWHAARLMDATYRDGGCPNNDTLYSLAWLDLSDEPVILSHPDMAERYFTFELMGFTSDNIDYIGQRTTGSTAGHFAIAGPGWQGELPDGVRSVTPSPTPWVLVLGRTVVDGAADVPDACCRPGTGSPRCTCGARPGPPCRSAATSTPRSLRPRIRSARGRRSTRCWPRTRHRHTTRCCSTSSPASVSDRVSTCRRSPTW
jgi:hypothetical protein